MECPECKRPLMVAGSKFVAVNDDNPDTPTEIYSELTMVCINSAIDPVKKMHVCSLYCGPDLNQPLKVAATVRNKVG
jgi:hypothetical protein